MTPSTLPSTHLGRKIERIRELRGMKQDTLADLLGISQQAVSKMEQSEQIDEERLQKVSKALGVTPEAIRHFSEEALFNNINSIHDNHENSVNTFHVVNYQFNPIEKIVELYERLLKSEQEKLELLQRQTGRKD